MNSTEIHHDLQVPLELLETSASVCLDIAKNYLKWEDKAKIHAARLVECVVFFFFLNQSHLMNFTYFIQEYHSTSVYLLWKLHRSRTETLEVRVAKNCWIKYKYRENVHEINSVSLCFFHKNIFTYAFLISVIVTV